MVACVLLSACSSGSASSVAEPTDPPAPTTPASVGSLGDERNATLDISHLRGLAAQDQPTVRHWSSQPDRSSRTVSQKSACADSIQSADRVFANVVGAALNVVAERFHRAPLSNESKIDPRVRRHLGHHKRPNGGHSSGRRSRPSSRPGTRRTFRTRDRRPRGCMATERRRETQAERVERLLGHRRRDARWVRTPDRQVGCAMWYSPGSASPSAPTVNAKTTRSFWFRNARSTGYQRLSSIPRTCR